MKITKKLRTELEKYLPKNYRKIIVERLAGKGISVHANTVSNTLAGMENIEVAIQLIRLSNEKKAEEEKLHKEFNKSVKQLTTA